MHDKKTDELYARVTQPGKAVLKLVYIDFEFSLICLLDIIDIAIPKNVGIAGTAFISKKPVNVQSAYTDTRFYSGVDRSNANKNRKKHILIITLMST